MHIALLSSSVLYLASSAAQVWAALMVFQVLLARDICFYRDKEQTSVATDARCWLGVLLDVAHKDHLAAWSRDLGIDILRTLVSTAKGDLEAEMKLLRAVSTHQLFRARLVQGTINGVAYEPSEIQEQVDGLVMRLTTMANEFPEPVEAFQIGVYSLALNLGGLATYSFLGNSASSLVGILGALVIGNFALGWRFAAHVRLSLECY